MSAWTDHVKNWKDCIRCPLGQQRDRICLARGSVPCDVLFVGEAPGASEDAIGLPFVGPAGRLLDQIVDRAIGSTLIKGPVGYNGVGLMDDPKPVTTAFTNLVACFPAEAKAEGINEPHMSEIKACRERLVEFVNTAQPRLIVCVGALASEHVDHGDTVPCVDIVHPAFILARLPLAQKQMAVQREIVRLRCAVEKMLESPRQQFTKWGDRYANLTSAKDRVRADYSEAGIPF